MRTIQRLLVALSVVVLGWTATPAHAQIYNPALNVVGRSPGATVLIPYFEVNLAKADGMTTVFSINNASATAVLAHVNVMTDLGVLALGFNVYLTGYDVQTINMRDIINGIMPQTASAGQDPGDKISPHGQVSQDINFASCNGILPTPNLPANYTTHLKNSLTGKGTTFYGGNCVGLNYGDSVARGYVTIDTVNACALLDPANPGYAVYLTNQNVLWSDAYFLDTRNKVSRGAPVVSVAANNANDPLVSTPGNYTFYGKYNAWTASDRRQPLATNFAARYQKSGAFGKSSSLIVWRDPKVAGAPFTCGGSGPNFLPLAQEEIVAFDDQENPTAIGGTPFGAMAQRVVVGSAALPVAANSGWFYLNLNTSVAAAGSNPPVDPAAAQGWVSSVLEGTGASGYSTTSPAAALDSATNTVGSHDLVMWP
ncbi:MAG: hypothetical protein IPK07_20590 [Deltaproteobacteria bacterium]|nr:hypothetical protein [Deltaproteobacteria bacterium]